ncbi:hypothetical protein Tco_0648942 [Tanacetum coccineum]
MPTVIYFLKAVNSECSLKICGNTGFVPNMTNYKLSAQSQAREQSMVEAEKDFKKMIGHMSETHETMEVSSALMSVLKAFRLYSNSNVSQDCMFQASYMDVLAEAQARATRLGTTTIPELEQSVEKAIDTLRTHYVAALT